MTDTALRLPSTTLEDRSVGWTRRVSHSWWTASRILGAADLVAALVISALASVTAWLAVPLPVLVTLVPAWVACLAITHAWDRPWPQSRARSCVRVLRAGCSLALLGTALSLVSAEALTAADAFLVTTAWAAVSCGLRLVPSSFGAGDRPARRVLLVVGSGGTDQSTAAMFERIGAEVSVLEVTVGTGDGEIAQPDLRHVVDRARDLRVAAVAALPASGLDAWTVRRLQWELEEERLPFYVELGVLGVAPTRLAPSTVGGHTMVHVHAAQRGGVAWSLIAWAERLLAVLALTVLLPVLGFIALAIRRESPGPALFRQTRVGEDGRQFTIVKFRTMGCAPCPEAIANDFDQVLFKMRTDPRVTDLGRWLRRYSLDELPQLVNVALGQMRLVGPRPALPEEVSAYSFDARRRLAVKPGITGLWQVSGRSDLSWEETVRLDLHYVDNWSPWLDLTILARTLGAVVGHRGAY